MRHTATIVSAVKELSIESCKKNHEEYIAAFFTDDERCAMRGRPVQSIAGICVVKQALVALCCSIDARGSFAEKAFTIMHKAGGAPEIVRFPDFSVDNRAYTKDLFSISISHTRTTAYGLAVVEERFGDHCTHPV